MQRAVESRKRDLEKEMTLLKDIDDPELDVNKLKTTLGLIKHDTIYVSNIPYHFREEDLDDLFGDCGKIISIRMPEDKLTRRNKGFGFVKMDSERSARKALKYDGHRVENRPLKVSLAENKIHEEQKDDT
mmetsp:Transcript_4010/g.2717  ORF Transcript_4010/g.2717 Transcript_4010/m.2717 type:complete len:130 (+) Transcript_4010:1012-1401(+)